VVVGEHVEWTEWLILPAPFCRL